MRISWKIIIIIFLLSTIATLLSTFIAPNVKLVCPGCDYITANGFPSKFIEIVYDGNPFYKESYTSFRHFNFLAYTIDFLFYFGIISLTWIGLKFATKRGREKDQGAVLGIHCNQVN